MNMIYKIYKKTGETPLQALERFRSEYNLQNKKLTYANRLDPLAEGEMLILSDNDLLNKEKYTNLEKKYTVKVLFGISTDTGDLLGKVVKVDHNFEMDLDTLNKLIPYFIGKHKWTYPVFSAKVVNGRKLFDFYLKGDIDNIKIPTYEGEIKRITKNKEYKIKGIDLLSEITDKLSLLKNSTIKEKYNDFRKDEILTSFHKEINLEHEYTIVEFSLHVTSKMFMRTFAEKLGGKLGTCALAFNIKRDKILM